MATIGGTPVWQMREVSSQNSFNGHNSLFVHFGLGDATTVDSLLIEWRSGRVDRLADETADRLLELTEGESPALVASESEAPIEYQVILYQNYPNPFNDNTNISFTLDRARDVRLEVIDQLGRILAVPTGGLLEAGSHTAAFSGTGLLSGIYVYRLRVGNSVITRRMTVVR